MLAGPTPVKPGTLLPPGIYSRFLLYLLAVLLLPHIHVMCMFTYSITTLIHTLYLNIGPFIDNGALRTAR